MELQSIYRVYRPQSWDEIVGQEWIVTTLTNQIKHDSLAHAYLFTGPRGIGKTTSARLLAKILNCQNRKKGGVDPCNTCASCEEIQKGSSLNVFEIDAASQTGVDSVRENIIAASRVGTTDDKKRVFIIDEVHGLSGPAFNALLKTLEEPPKNVFFVMATTEIHKVPDTIISRCQRFDFRRVKEADMVKRLAMIAKKEKVKISEDVLREVARHAEGGMRDAEGMLGQLLSFGTKEVTWEQAQLLLPKGDRVRALQFCRQCIAGEVKEAQALLTDFMETGGDAEVFSRDCIEVVRRSLSAAMSQKKEEDVLSTSIPVLTDMLQRLLIVSQQIPKTYISELPLEIFIAEYMNDELGMHLPAGKAGNAELKTPRLPTNNAHETKSSSVSRDPDGVQRRSPSVSTENKVETKEITQKPSMVIASDPEPVERERGDLTGHSVDITEIQKRWNEVHETAKKYNHSLALVFKVATLLDVQGNVMTLGFRHSFYADRLAERAHQETAAKVFAEMFGRPFTFACKVIANTVDEPVLVPVTTADPVLNTILETFGGKVIG